MAKSAPKLWQALLPLVVLIALLVANLLVFGDGSLGGPNQFALLAGAAVALVVGIVNGHRFPDLVDHMTRSIATAVPALLILLLIGSLAGSWLLSGTVPARSIPGTIGNLRTTGELPVIASPSL